jgi:DnaA family protein
VVFLHGASGGGKSHLLQASCHQVGRGALYLPMSEIASYPPVDVLQSVENLDLVCLDDIHAVVGDPAWETALFHFFNRARETGCALQFAAEAAPRNLPIKLPDLRSRLSWAVVFQLAVPADEEKAEILRFRAARRGLALAPEVATFIVNRAPRNLDDLLALLDALDRASLAEQRSLSLPFVKSTLGW